MVADEELPKLFFASQASWEEWLADNHKVSEGVWIKIAAAVPPGVSCL